MRGRKVVRPVVDVVVALLRIRNGSTFSRGRFQLNLGGAGSRLPSTSASNRFVCDRGVETGETLLTPLTSVGGTLLAPLTVAPTCKDLALPELR